MRQDLSLSKIDVGLEAFCPIKDQDNTDHIATDSFGKELRGNSFELSARSGSEFKRICSLLDH